MLPAAALSDRLSVDINGVQALRAQARAGDPEALKAAARQFEAMFVQIMLKTMRATRFSAEGDPYADSNSLKLYQDLLDQQWAQKMAAGKGLGFADMIIRRLNVEATGQRLLDDAALSGNPTAEKATASPIPAPVPTPLSQPGLEQRGQAGGDSQAETPPAQVDDPRRRFVEAMQAHARAAEQATGVPARFILAHAALESGWGKREILTTEGASSHNLFGIKAGRGWDGATAETLTTEYRQGLAMTVTERFRAYAGYAEAFTDYAGLLQRRYRDAAAAGEDAAAFVNGLVNGGYATDPAYGAKLQGVIRVVAAVGI